MRRSTHANPWLVRREGPARTLRLFCFPYAGGSAASYAHWQAALPERVEVCALQLPGRGSRFHEAPAASLPALVDALADVVAGQGTLPFAFFGHSLGGLLAFETARRLRTLGAPQPVHLFVSGTSAPARRGAARGLHALPDAALVEELRRYNGTPPEVLANAELMALVLPALRADFALAERYRYEPAAPLDVPLTVLAGADDRVAPPAQADGWRDETRAAFRQLRFDGDHFFIHAQSPAVIGCVSRLLDGDDDGSQRHVRGLS